MGFFMDGLLASVVSVRRAPIGEGAEQMPPPGQSPPHGKRRQPECQQLLYMLYDIGLVGLEALWTRCRAAPWFRLYTRRALHPAAAPALPRSARCICRSET